MHKKSNFKLLLLISSLAIASCATQKSITQQAPGFLPNYSLLKAVDSPKGTQIYVYKNSAINPQDYNAAIVEPVTLYQDATSESTITAEQIEVARETITAGVKDIVSHKIKITDAAGIGVAKVQVAITGATLEHEGLKPWNIIPISAAITLAKKAANLDNKQAVMVVEIKVTDSLSGELIKETATTINSEEFRMQSNTVAEFEALANEWVRQALIYSNKK